jgi:hypothetical protein
VSPERPSTAAPRSSEAEATTKHANPAARPRARERTRARRATERTTTAEPLATAAEPAPHTNASDPRESLRTAPPRRTPPPRTPPPSTPPTEPRIPRQGFETEEEISPGSTVHPPSRPELASAVADLLGELAQGGLTAGGRLLKDVLARLPGV